MGKNSNCGIQGFRFFKCLPAVLLLCATACFVQPTGVLAAEAKKAQGKEPIIITSQSLIADNAAKTATFVGNVVARKGEATLYAEKMIVYSRKDADQGKEPADNTKPKSDQDKGDIEKIEADGNVRMVKGSRVITSRFATYYADHEERVVFTGDPKAAEGQNVVTGTKMTYFIRDDRSFVENSKVFLINKERKHADSETRKGKAR